MASQQWFLEMADAFAQEAARMQGAGAGGGGGGGTTVSEAALPFAASSPFNTLTPPGTNWYDHARLHTLPDSSYQHWYAFQGYRPVYATVADPVWTFIMPDYIAPTFHRNRPAQTFTGVHAPANLATAGGTDNIVTVIQPDGSYIEVWQAVVNTGTFTVTGNSGAGWATGSIATGLGVGDLSNNAGVRAANFSWAAGLLTAFDIAHGSIDHALVCLLPGQMLDDRSAHYRSPATAWDNASGSLGPFDCGTKIGVPAGVSPPIGLSAIGLMVFNAFQRYGCYVGDFTGGSWPAIQVSSALADVDIQPLYAWWQYGGLADIDRIQPLMRVADYQP